MDASPQGAEGLAERGVGPMSATRVPQIFSALSAAERPVGLTQLSRTLNVPKTSLIGLLRGLVHARFLVFSDGAYGLGPNAFILGRALVEAGRRLHYTSDIIREGMRELSSRTGETVLFAVLNGNDPWSMIYVDIAESRDPIRLTVSIGDQRPLYCNAGGRVFLAERSDEEVIRYLDASNLEELGQHSEISKAALLRAVQKARVDQVARPLPEAVYGMGGIASLIRGPYEEVMGALIAVAPLARLENGGERLSVEVRDAARAISQNLGHSRIAAE
jgi:DNA-binding IclR family transcriptional regulator